ncbi:MAG: MFS transporter [Henriciella sp.]
MHEFSAGWKIVLTAMLGVAFSGTNILLYSVGAIAPELSATFGWSHGAIQLGSLVSILVTLISLPIVSILSDRLGVRVVTLWSVVLASACLFLHAFLPNQILIFYLIVAITAFACAGTLPLTWTKMVTTWFRERLGLALGLTLLGTGLGGALLKPLVAGLIAEFGWRGAYVGLACIPLVIVLPLVLMWFRSPDGVEANEAENQSPERDGGFGAILTDWRFWVIAIAYLPIGFAVPGLITNMELILGSSGGDESVVVIAAALFGVFVIIGRIVGGYLLDRFNPSLVGATLILSLSIAFVILAGQDLSPNMIILAIALAGFGTGVEFDVLSYLIDKIFGSALYNKAFGGAMAVLYLGAAFGPFLFGRTYDTNGNFDAILIPTAIGVAVASVLVGCLYRNLHSHEAGAKNE